jgi:3-oxoadipate enol-lactonase
MDGTKEHDVDGLYVVEVGAGPPVLLLHGIGSSARSFHHQLQVLGDSFRMLAWDAPGYARSADPEGVLDLDGYADAAATVLEVADAAPAHIVGVSWGGVIAARLAVRRPDHVRSLVLADSTRGSGTSAEKAAAMLRRGDELAQLGAQEFASSRAHRLVSPAAPDELVEQVVNAMADAVRLPGYAYAAASMAETDHTDLLARIAVPTLVLVGEHDSVTPPEESKRLAAAIRGAEFDVIEGAGHLSNLERPSQFTDRVRRFLDAQERDQPTT